MASKFEDLPNELLYEIFDYLDTFHAYQAFFTLNKRFKHLFLYSNLPIQIDISPVSKSSFEDYSKTFILPNKHRINYLHLSNPFTIDIIFSPIRLISQFILLEILILDQIHSNYLSNLFLHLIFLPKLHSLTIHPIDSITNSTDFYQQIFRLPKLKYCQIEFETKTDQDSLLIYNNQPSSLEYLIIKNRFRFHSLSNLFLYLPNLRCLSINCLDGSSTHDISFSPIHLQNFKRISLKLDLISFDHLEKLIKTSFYSIESLCLTTKYDPAYLDAKRWENLIQNFIPNLRIFDFNHDGLVRNHSFTYHDLLNQFHSSFWIEKQWFFTHQHDWQERLDTGIFHSTKPYRRKDYTFYWDYCHQNIQATNLSSVQHLRIGSQKAQKTGGNYFPNVTELTIDYYYQTSDDSISTTLNRLVCLKKITKLNLDSSYFPLEQLIELIHSIPNLHTLKYQSIASHERHSLREVSKTNRIKHLEIRGTCTLENIETIVYLFPRLEYLKVKLLRRDRREIIRCLLLNTEYLSFLCIVQISKISFQKISLLIETENFLEDYCIKLINRDLFLWW